MEQTITDKVAVITGASSGIGEATAYALAKKGFNLVLAARRNDVLEDVAKKCRKEGIQAIAIKTDTSKADDVARLSEKAINTFGHYDVWVNNASNIMYGRFLDIKDEEFRQLIETNLFGYVAGARAALQQFQNQGHGTLINVASAYGGVAAPYSSAYVASKFAVRGLGSALRQELIADRQHNIHVCTVMPGTVDTPIYQNAANRMERAVKAMPPVFTPERVAGVIVSLTEHPKPEVSVGRSMRVPMILFNLSPRLFEAGFSKYVAKFNYQDQPSVPGSGNLFKPSDNASMRGGWAMKRSLKFVGFGVVITATTVIMAILKGSKGRK